MVWPFIWTYLKSFVPSLVEIGLVEKKIFKFRQCIFTDSLEKGKALHLIKPEFPSPKDALLPSLVEIAQVVLEKRMKMWKVYGQMDGWQAIRKAHLSFQLRWAKKEKFTDRQMEKKLTANDRWSEKSIETQLKTVRAAIQVLLS